jgi:hypothetical protein
VAALQTILTDLNIAFGTDRIAELVAQREAFEPGKPLASGLVVKRGSRFYKVWQQSLAALPASFQDTLQGLIRHALSTSPPTNITFAWAPGYDYELTVWQAPDTRETKGGITILVKSRYPADAHPVRRARPVRRVRSAKRAR